MKNGIQRTTPTVSSQNSHNSFAKPCADNDPGVRIEVWVYCEFFDESIQSVKYLENGNKSNRTYGLDITALLLKPENAINRIKMVFSLMFNKIEYVFM